MAACEETLMVRVHREFLEKQRLPPALVTKNIWKERFHHPVVRADRLRDDFIFASADNVPDISAVSKPLPHFR